jgi:ferredoxin
MEIDKRKLLLCDCERTMPLDGRTVGKACGFAGPADLQTQLCRSQLDNFRAAVAAGGPLLVSCTQEAPLFLEVAAEIAQARQVAPDIAFANIRERAGWSDEGANASPKIAALLAEAALAIEPAAALTLKSAGVCLVYGRDETALDAARQIAGRLDVTVLLDRPAEILPPRVTDVPIFRGHITAAKGHLGAFEIIVDDYAAMRVSSRNALAFEAPRNGAASRCDLILDLTGDAPLFPAPEKRDGYLRPDPRNPAAVQRALFDLVDMVGEFEKPRYIRFDADLCAHSRNRKTGCTRCLDVCPTSAIRPDGDHVVIDPHVCAGCGACHSVCPTGAASYALPSSSDLLIRLRTLLGAYRTAGGKQPALLLHDQRHGDELIGAMAQRGRGLPARVLPFAVNEVTQIGFEFLSAAFAYGAAQLLILVPPGKSGELEALAGQIGLMETVMTGLGFGSGRIGVLREQDPEIVEAELYDLPMMEPAATGSFLPMGGKRALIRLALGHLHDVAPAPIETLPLAPGAPFGAVAIDAQGCTLCLACVGACPTGALQDNPETPQLRFQEDACIQCGLCRNTCPENVITLVPQLNFTAGARDGRVMKEEEPFCCVRCGKPFGTKGSVERILAKLGEKHSMFASKEAAERIKMCNDCRVIAQFENKSEPFAGAARPLTRTTDDDIRERDLLRAAQPGHNGPGNGSGTA